MRPTVAQYNRRVRRWLQALVALNGSPRGIAGGFTLGMGLSLVPIPFLGMFTALALAPILRCNLPATYLGTAVVNPVTGTAFYFAELWLGTRILGIPTPSWADLQELDTRGWTELLLELLGPFATGAMTLVGASLVTVFPLIYLLTRRWQAARPHAGPPHDPEAARASSDHGGGGDRHGSPPGPG